MIHPGDVVYLADPAAIGRPSRCRAPTTSVTWTRSPSTNYRRRHHRRRHRCHRQRCRRRPPRRPRRRCRRPRRRSPPSERRRQQPTTGRRRHRSGIGQAALIATGIVALLAARRRARLRAAEPPARIPLPSPDTIGDRAHVAPARRQRAPASRRHRVARCRRRACRWRAADRRRPQCAATGRSRFTSPRPPRSSAPWRGAERRWTMPRHGAGRRSGCQRPGGRGAVRRADTDRCRRARTGTCSSTSRRPAARRRRRAPSGRRRSSAPSPSGWPAPSSPRSPTSSASASTRTAFLGHRHAQVVPTVDEAIELAATLIGTHRQRRLGSTFSLRSHHTGGEMWEPAVIVVATAHAPRRGAGAVTAADLGPRRAGHRRRCTARAGAVDAATRWRRPVVARAARSPAAAARHRQPRRRRRSRRPRSTDTDRHAGRRAVDATEPRPRSSIDTVSGDRRAATATTMRRPIGGTTTLLHRSLRSVDGADRRRRPAVVDDGPPARPASRSSTATCATGQVRTLEDARAGDVAGDPSSRGRAGQLRARRCGTSTFATPRSPTSCPRLAGRWPATSRRPPATSGCAGR